MDIVNKHYNSGTVEVMEYNITDKAGSRVRNLIMDLWQNIADEDLMKYKIIYSMKMKVAEGHTLEELISEFSTEESKFENELVFVEAGRLEDGRFKSAEELLEIASKDVEILKNNNFANIIFNRVMGLSYGVSFYYILRTSSSKEFIDKYLGTVISRVVE